jgi:pectinesterase
VRQPNPNRTLAEHGFVTATIDYRLSHEAIFPAQIHDVKAAIRFLRDNHQRFGIDPERIGVWGHSAGGHLAALAGVAGNVPELEGDGGTAGVSSAVQAAAPLSPPTLFERTARRNCGSSGIPWSIARNLTGWRALRVRRPMSAATRRRS